MVMIWYHLVNLNMRILIILITYHSVGVITHWLARELNQIHGHSVYHLHISQGKLSINETHCYSSSTSMQ